MIDIRAAAREHPHDGVIHVKQQYHAAAGAVPPPYRSPPSTLRTGWATVSVHGVELHCLVIAQWITCATSVPSTTI